MAAALALETEHIRAERGDWRVAEGDPPCAASCVLDWAQLQLVQRGAPDQAERAWYFAAAALAGGVRDWRYLQRPVDPERSPRLIPALMERALARFPDDPSLRLDRALAAAGRFNMMIDGGRLAPSIPLPARLVDRTRWDVHHDAGSRSATAADLLAPLVDDPLVGAEARVRLGYLYWAYGRDETAREELAKAAERAPDADLRYLAQFLLGWIAIKRGDTAGAIPRLEAALAARPAIPIGGARARLPRAPAWQRRQGECDRPSVAGCGGRRSIRGGCFSTGTIRAGPAPRGSPPGDEAMTARFTRLAAVALVTLALGGSVLAAGQTTFRATTAVVAVSVSVKRGNTVVANLKAADFTLTDNGVPQTVEAVLIEDVPIDATLFLDTSGSTAGKLDEMRQDVQTMLQLLRAGDRFRLLTIGDAVSLPVAWVPRAPGCRSRSRPWAASR